MPISIVSRCPIYKNNVSINCKLPDIFYEKEYQQLVEDVIYTIWVYVRIFQDEQSGKKTSLKMLGQPTDKQTLLQKVRKGFNILRSLKYEMIRRNLSVVFVN